jgi:hypothetical protein
MGRRAGSRTRPRAGTTPREAARSPVRRGLRAARGRPRPRCAAGPRVRACRIGIMCGMWRDLLRAEDDFRIVSGVSSIRYRRVRVRPPRPAVGGRCLHSAPCTSPRPCVSGSGSRDRHDKGASQCQVGFCIFHRIFILSYNPQVVHDRSADRSWITSSDFSPLTQLSMGPTTHRVATVIVAVQLASPSPIMHDPLSGAREWKCTLRANHSLTTPSSSAAQVARATVQPSKT